MLRFIWMLLAATASALTRRLRRGPLHPRWTFRQEAVVDALRRNGEYLMRLSPGRARAHLAATAQRSRASRRVGWELEDADGLPAVWLRHPAGEGRPTVLYFHGGGYVFGSTGTYCDLLARLALASGANVVAVDYRLAPEHPFPAAVDDALRSYRWLLGRAVDPSHVVIAGDSSGGALALTTLLAARDAGDPLPAGAVLVSPWVDLEAASASVTSNERFDWGGRRYLQHWARLYLATADARSPLASPVHADLNGLPPLLALVGSVELLNDEVRALADRVRRGGGAVEIEVFDGMVHGWVLMPAVFREASQALDRIGRFVRTVTRPKEPPPARSFARDV